MNREELGQFTKAVAEDLANEHKEMAPPPELALKAEREVAKFNVLLQGREVTAALVKSLIGSHQLSVDTLNLLIKERMIPEIAISELLKNETISIHPDGGVEILEDMTDYALYQAEINKFLQLNDGQKRISTLKLKTLMREHAITENDFNALVKTGHISQQNIDDLIKGDDIEWNNKTGRYIIIEELMPQGEFFDEEGNPTELLKQHQASTNLRDKKKAPSKPIAHIRKPE